MGLLASQKVSCFQATASILKLGPGWENAGQMMGKSSPSVFLAVSCAPTVGSQGRATSCDTEFLKVWVI